MRTPHLTYHAKEYALILQQMNESLEFNVLKAAENAAPVLETGCTAVGDGACRAASAQQFGMRWPRA